MPVSKFTISRNDSVYECFPHLCRTRSGRILLAYRESNGHVASEFCRLIVRYSDDTGHHPNRSQMDNSLVILTRSPHRSPAQFSGVGGRAAKMARSRDSRCLT